MLVISVLLVCLLAVQVQAQNDCREDEMFSCLEPMLIIYQGISENLVSGRIDLPAIADSCPEYRKYERCVPTSCLTDVFLSVHQLLTDAFSYVCNDVLQDIQRSRLCLSDSAIKDQYKACGDEASRITIENKDPCQFYTEIEACIDDVTRSSCGLDEARLVRDYLLVANSQQKTELGCETSLPIFPNQEEISPEGDSELSPPSLSPRCWDCNSGSMSRDSNALCPVNGDLKTDLLTSVMCSEACFVRTDRWNKNIVYRGCSAGHYLPADLEKNGCVENPDEGVVWCFCNSNKCNTQDMTTFLDERLRPE